MATENSKNKTGKTSPKKDKGLDEFEDIELDLDFDLESEDISSDFPDLEDIDLNEDTEDLDDESELDKTDLLENTQQLFKKIKDISTIEPENSKTEAKPQSARTKNDTQQQSDLNAALMTKLAIIELNRSELNNLGLDTSIVNELITEAKNFIDESDLSSAKTLINNSENLTSNILLDHRMNLISTIISFIETFIFELTELDLNFKYAEAYFIQAKNSLNDKNLSAANKYIQNTLENVDKVLNNSRAEKIKEATKFFDFWFTELSDEKIDEKKLKGLIEEVNKSISSDQIEKSESQLQKLTYSAKAEINKLGLSIEKKEDLIQQLDGIYEFEDYSSLSDALNRVENMLMESIEKDKIHQHLKSLLDSYKLIIESHKDNNDSEIEEILTQFNDAKESFEKDEYKKMTKILENISSKLLKSKPETDIDKFRKLDKKGHKEKTDLEESLESNLDEDSVEPVKPIGSKEAQKPDVDPSEVLKLMNNVKLVEKEINDLKNYNIKVEEFTKDIVEIKNMIETKDLEAGYDRLAKVKESVSKFIEQRDSEEQKKINELQKVLLKNIKAAKKDGIKTDVAEDLLNYAKQRLRGKKYSDVLEILEHAQDVLDGSITETKLNKLKDEAVKLLNDNKKILESLTEDHPNYKDFNELYSEAKSQFEIKKFEKILDMKEQFKDIVESINSYVPPEPANEQDDSIKHDKDEPDTEEIVDKIDELKELEINSLKSKFTEHSDELISKTLKPDIIADKIENDQKPLPSESKKPEPSEFSDEASKIKSITGEHEIEKELTDDIDLKDSSSSTEPAPNTETVNETTNEPAIEPSNEPANETVTEPSSSPEDLLDDDSEQIKDRNNVPDYDDISKLKTEDVNFNIRDPQELVKEAFGFKLKRDFAASQASGEQGKNGVEQINYGNQTKSRIDEEEIHKIRSQMMSRINHKQDNQNSGKDLPPISDDKPTQHVHERRSTHEFETHNKGPLQHNLDQRRGLKNGINGPYLTPSIQKARFNGAGRRYPPQKEQRVLIHQSNKYAQQRSVNGLNGINGINGLNGIEGVKELNKHKPIHNRQVINGYDQIDQLDTPYDQYDSRLNTLKKGALKGLQEIQSIISDTYYFGANIEELERLSEDARNAFDDRDYQEVLLYVDKCEEISRHLKLSYMQSLIQELKISGENTEYLEYLFNETETAYNEEKYKIGDELARKFITVTRDLEYEEKIVNQTWVYCRFCGNSIPRDSVFCSFCGEKLF